MYNIFIEYFRLIMQEYSIFSFPFYLFYSIYKYIISVSVYLYDIYSNMCASSSCLRACVYMLLLYIYFDKIRMRITGNKSRLFAIRSIVYLFKTRTVLSSWKRNGINMRE